MEPEGSSPYSQEPSTGPYPESDRPSPHHVNCQPTYVLVFLVVSFLLASPPISYMHSSFLKYNSFFVYNIWDTESKVTQ
jgi:hypothetical protein